MVGGTDEEQGLPLGEEWVLAPLFSADEESEIGELGKEFDGDLDGGADPRGPACFFLCPLGTLADLLRILSGVISMWLLWENRALVSGIPTTST